MKKSWADKLQEQDRRDNLSKEKPFVLGIDIGGTSIKPKLFAVENGELSGKPVSISLDGLKDFPEGNKTLTGKSNHVRQVKALIRQAGAEAEKQGGALAAVGIGSPGRFDATTHRIKPGTNTNISGEGKETLDGVNLQNEYKKSLSRTKLKDITITVDNDATAMFTGIMNHLLHNDSSEVHNLNKETLSKKHLEGQQAALLGLGTGVGHTIKRVAGGQQHNITDGHASKLLIRVDDGDMDLLERADTYLADDRKPEYPAGNNAKNIVRAEDLFKSPTFNAIAEHPSKDQSSHDALSDATYFCGKYMARTIAAIASGQNRDIDPKNGWSEADKEAAAKTSIYILSGGLGGSEDGRLMMHMAQQELEILAGEAARDGNKKLADRLNKVELYQYTGEPVAERSAAEMALDTHLAKQKGL